MPSRPAHSDATSRNPTETAQSYWIAAATVWPAVAITPIATTTGAFMLPRLSRYTRLSFGLLWSSAFMAMLAHLLYGEVSLRQQAPRLGKT
ncbi:hypothetical protein [Ralstonia solanacearum]|uniref:hypothetical protein n=1 Tax=Ralstonia solanacearum TaxID=305 RepID=UPI001F1C8E2D|nr:hypothetical protein [Ralstonia solanacearum]MCL9846805.1 hypothetical protein [Ralstonia solanacearum]MCL9847440.1 hypothetical protein [Ralstonia solanacearum]MCL9852913.1 hypothetical protein [Ralstonia solanacearum]MCL9858240.1 hypothetical protein [Ralstonia solanacearum]MCL9862210.1 hypothetical protein [Ralstonia solanacearum]